MCPPMPDDPADAEVPPVCSRFPACEGQPDPADPFNTWTGDDCTWPDCTTPTPTKGTPA